MQIWYGWKYLVETFPTHIYFFFLYFLEFRLIYYDFLKFSGKIDFSKFFGDRLAAAAGSRLDERRQPAKGGRRKLSHFTMRIMSC